MEGRGESSPDAIREVAATDEVLAAERQQIAPVRALRSCGEAEENFGWKRLISRRCRASFDPLELIEELSAHPA
jgi:hypothetical protein